jgi:hypothetical protein
MTKKMRIKSTIYKAYQFIPKEENKNPPDKYKLKFINKIKAKSNAKQINTWLIKLDENKISEIIKNLLGVGFIIFKKQDSLKASSSNDLSSSSNDPKLKIRDSENVLNFHDIELLDGRQNNEILFKKIPYDVRKSTARKYADMI